MSPETGLRSSAISLALAGGLEFGLQMAIPIVLVRCLDETTFGQYRLLWLMASTALAIAPAFMPQSLFYFLARVGPLQKKLIIGNVLLYLIAAGGITGIVLSGWNPWLQDAAQALFFQTHGMSSLFLMLWVAAAMLDVLPTADGKARWQSNAIIGMALWRTLLLAAAALAGAGIAWIAGAMLAVAASKVLVLAYYIRTNTPEGRIAWQMAMLKKQLAYSLPFAVGNALFLLRMQADQWVVVSMSTPALYAMFSIASVVQPIATLIRQPVNNAMMPRLNAAHARGDANEIRSLINKCNGATALFLVPVVGMLFAAAPELVEIVYTARYQEAAPIMQVYLAGMLMNVFAVGHVLSALGKGRFAVINSACCLALSIALSIAGMAYLGLWGAASGSVLTLALGELWALKIVARALGMPMRRLLAWDALLPAMWATCFALVAVAVLVHYAAWHGFAMLLAKGVVYVGVFAPLFLLAGGWKWISLLLGRPGYQVAFDEGG